MAPDKSPESIEDDLQEIFLRQYQVPIFNFAYKMQIWYQVP